MLRSVWQAGQGPRHIAHCHQTWRFFEHISPHPLEHAQTLTRHRPTSCHQNTHTMITSRQLMSFFSEEITILIRREGILNIFTSSKLSNSAYSGFLGVRSSFTFHNTQTHFKYWYPNSKQKKAHILTDPELPIINLRSIDVADRVPTKSRCRVWREGQRGFMDQRDRRERGEGGWSHWEEFLCDDRASLWLPSRSR